MSGNKKYFAGFDAGAVKPCALVISTEDGIVETFYKKIEELIGLMPLIQNKYPNLTIFIEEVTEQTIKMANRNKKGNEFANAMINGGRVLQTAQTFIQLCEYLGLGGIHVKSQYRVNFNPKIHGTTGDAILRTAKQLQKEGKYLSKIPNSFACLVDKELFCKNDDLIDAAFLVLPKLKEVKPFSFSLNLTK